MCSVDGKIKYVEIAGVALRPHFVSRIEPVGKYKWHHFFIAAAMRAECPVQRF